jgi:hypothetical protein
MGNKYKSVREGRDGKVEEKSVVYTRVVVLLINHADLGPARLLHAIVSALEACH